MAEQFESTLLERDRPVFSAFLERWRPLGMAIKERLPAQVETVADLLKRLAVERQPFLPGGLAQSGKMALELSPLAAFCRTTDSSADGAPPHDSMRRRQYRS